MSLPVGWHPQDETINRLIYGAANNAMRRYHDYVEREDLWQECLAWVLEHPRKVDECLAEDEKQLTYALENEAMRYGLKQKSLKLGFQVEDLFWWQRSAIEEGLVQVFNESWENRSEEIVGGNPVSSVNWLLVDVSRAFDALNDKERSLLTSYYRDGDTQGDIAATYGVSQGTVSNQITRAVKKMHRTLGGYRPREHECEECVGTRTVMSNAAAVALTERNEDGE